MKDLPIHLLLLAIIGVAIAGIGAIYSEPDDRRSLRSVPRRLAVFLLGCGLVAGVMLLVEHTLASVD
jgi:hypothetical protein